MIRFLSRTWLGGALLLVGALAGGCANYTTPGRGADFGAMGLTPKQRDQLTDAGIASVLDKKPLAAFPTSIAVVRVESSEYRSETAEGWGSGNYSVVFVRDVEKSEQFDRLAKLPLILGIAPLNEMLLPSKLQDDRDLRQAAAQLHADMLLVYTIDTKFYDQDMAGILTVFTLGASPNQHISVTTTASAVLVDTRNGYVYGTAEATQKHDGLTNAWFSDAAVDTDRRNTEAAAFDKLVGEFANTWTGVVKQYANTGPTTMPMAH
jgi:hypothetical protein